MWIAISVSSVLPLSIALVRDKRIKHCQGRVRALCKVMYGVGGCCTLIDSVLCGAVLWIQTCVAAASHEA